MSIDILQEKIRKTKNPSVLELSMCVSQLPPAVMGQEQSVAAAYASTCRELLEQLKGSIAAVRVSFSAFALLGHDGLYQLSQTLQKAGELGYYVILDAPEILSPAAAQNTAQNLLGEESLYPCDGVVVGGYLGSDVIKAFLPYCAKGKKDLFVVVRTANKSAPEVQDLLSGTRVVHAVAADHVNRYGADTLGKFGYTQVGILAGASAADSLRSLRAKYPRLFLLVDGYDYPKANAKNCSYAFDKFGHGAAVCGSGIATAWMEAGSDSSDWLVHAQAAADRMKKNLSRYITIL